VSQEVDIAGGIAEAVCDDLGGEAVEEGGAEGLIAFVSVGLGMLEVVGAGHGPHYI
jgi:hypothetical protein